MYVGPVNKNGGPYLPLKKSTRFNNIPDISYIEFHYGDYISISQAMSASPRLESDCQKQSDFKNVGDYPQSPISLKCKL